MKLSSLEQREQILMTMIFLQNCENIMWAELCWMAQAAQHCVDVKTHNY